MSEVLKYVLLHEVHVALGGKMVPFAGYSMPLRYSTDTQEHMCVREAVGLFDVSHMGQIFVSGRQATAFLQQVTTNDVAQLAIGQAQYTCITHEDGGIVDDVIVYKLTENEYFIVVNASNTHKDHAHLLKYILPDTQIQNQSDNWCLFALQGPKAKEVLKSISQEKIEEIKYYHFIQGQIAGVEAIISNTGYTGAGGFELMVKNTDAINLWQAVMKTGEPYGIQPIGLGARDTLRLEMGFALYGNDINDHTTPIEAGLGWITKFYKTFNGGDILKKQKEEGVTKKLIGFVMTERAIPRAHYEICDHEGKNIGEVTSGGHSPLLQLGIGLGYVHTSHATENKDIYIKIRENLAKAVVKKPPFIQK
ncbi:MAG: glycine cleavage system aminomethyltransferase GcvT [Cytophagales bacterium]|nr:glycine cleavage system aminomethyltransferase GcvT [Cytophagales bacterium]